MLYFLDTSALVKEYHDEKGTDIINEIFNNLQNSIFASLLSLSEVTSALNKLHNLDHINRREMDIALSKLSLDFCSGKIKLFDIESKQILHSQELILDHNLTSSDAIILSSALELKPNPFIFVSSDNRLLRAAEQLGISTLNPLS